MNFGRWRHATVSRILVAAMLAIAVTLALAGCGVATPGSPNGGTQAPNSGSEAAQPPQGGDSPNGGGTAGNAAQPGSNEQTVAIKVFFTKYASPTSPAEFVAVTRRVPKTSATIRGALEELLKGPTAEEKAAGLSSWFSDKTAGMIRGVNLKDGRAIVDFDDISKIIPNASASEGSHTLLGQLGSTIAQFANVKEIEYRLNGDNAAFMGWLQMSAGAVPAEPWRQK